MLRGKRLIYEVRIFGVGSGVKKNRIWFSFAALVSYGQGFLLESYIYIHIDITHTHIHTRTQIMYVHTHTHTHTHIYIYIYIIF